MIQRRIKKRARNRQRRWRQWFNTLPPDEQRALVDAHARLSRSVEFCLFYGDASR